MLHASDQFKEKFINLVRSQKNVPSSLVHEAEALRSLDEIAGLFIQRGVLTRDEALDMKGKAYGFPVLHLEEKKNIPPHVLNLIPQEVAETYRVVAVDQKGNELLVGVVNPTDLKAQEAVQFLARKLGLKAKFYLLSHDTFEEVLGQYAALRAEVQEALDVAQSSFRPEEEEGPLAAERELGEVIKSAPISKMVSVILRHAVEQKASDVHIEPGVSGSRVRYRIDGVLRTLLELPQYIHPAVVSRIKVMAHLKIDETRRPQDGRIRLKFGDRMIDFRVSILPLYEREKVVLRVLDSSSKAINLEDLGFWGRNLELIQANTKKPNGLFLVTGPTGSGKSTTLYAVLNILNKETVNIITLEDPVEYYLPGVNQSQIRPEVGLTFAAGLRSILRQDPDIIMVGEIRDNETAELAIHASLTGHFVLSTLHTNDALGAIPRLLDMKVEAFLLASTLNLVIAQRLVRRICQHCRTRADIPEDVAHQLIEGVRQIPNELLPSEIQKENLSAENVSVWKGKGCPRCNDTGYSGRSAISEVIDVNEQLRVLIAKRASDQELRSETEKQGYLSIEQDGLIKVLQGITTMEEVMRVTRE